MTRQQALAEADRLLRSLRCVKRRRACREWQSDLNTVADALQTAWDSRLVARVSIIDDVLKLKHDYESKREAAITELLMQQNKIRKQLGELGYDTV
jgi:hypothetical protein